MYLELVFSRQYCVTLTVEEGICLFQGSKTEAGTTQITPCENSVIQGSSVRAFTHTILPLETGLHRLRFTLRSQLGSEILVKTLNVVVRQADAQRCTGRDI